ncbi:hypothetical protein PG985_016065 [Apiospora marii]|uniref:uncharacterized protein n=1 Tax=Apiospora marii TaxID=335849 RepID=UPI00312F0C1E
METQERNSDVGEEAGREKGGNILVELVVASSVGGQRDDLVVISIADLGRVTRVEVEHEDVLGGGSGTAGVRLLLGASRGGLLGVALGQDPGRGLEGLVGGRVHDALVELEGLAVRGEDVGDGAGLVGATGLVALQERGGGEAEGGGARGEGEDGEELHGGGGFGWIKSKKVWWKFY